MGPNEQGTHRSNEPRREEGVMHSIRSELEPKNDACGIRARVRIRNHTACKAFDAGLRYVYARSDVQIDFGTDRMHSASDSASAVTQRVGGGGGR